MNTVFLVKFENDPYADLQCELYEVAEKNGWTVDGAIKIEFLDEMTVLAKDKAERFNKKASIKIWVLDECGDFNPDPDYLVSSYDL